MTAPLPPCTAGDLGCGLDPCECRYPDDLLDRLLEQHGLNLSEIEREFAERIAAHEGEIRVMEGRR